MNHYQRSTRNFLAVSDLDRMAIQRRSDDWVSNQLNNPATRFVPVWRDMNFFSNEETPTPVFPTLTDLKEINNDLASVILLGQNHDQIYFALDIPSDDSSTTRKLAHLGQFQNLRQSGFALTNDQAVLLAYAKAITYWHQNNRFCGKCASPNTIKEAGHNLVCSNENCLQQHFPRTDPAIIVLVTYQDKCLLGRQANWPKGIYSTIAGFTEPAECLEMTVVREVFEETGIHVNKLDYHSSQPWPFPGTLMLGFMAEASNNRIVIDRHELEDARWFSRENLVTELTSGKTRIPLAYTIAYQLIETWFNQGDMPDLQDIVKSINQKIS